MGCSTSTPKVKAAELPLLRGLFLSALGSLLRHCFLLRLCGSTSDGPLGRHNGWAEPSTLIPDVDYGLDFLCVKHKIALLVKRSSRRDTRRHVQTHPRCQVSA